MNADKILEFISEFPEHREAIDAQAEPFVEILGSYIERFRSYLTLLQWQTYQQFKGMGATSEEAILLTLNVKLALAEAQERAMAAAKRKD